MEEEVEVKLEVEVSMEVEVEVSMEEDTEEEDVDRVTTPDLVREFSDLVEFGDPADSLTLVLNSSESGVEAEQHVEAELVQAKQPRGRSHTHTHTHTHIILYSCSGYEGGRGRGGGR